VHYVARESSPLLSDLTADQLLERARGYRKMAATARTAQARDSLNPLAVRFAMLGAKRDHDAASADK
jgi:hypothetical protein